MAEKQLFIAVHHHEYGTTVYCFHFTPTDAKPLPTEQEIVSHLNIDFEDDKEEWVDICEAGEIVDLDEALREKP